MSARIPLTAKRRVAVAAAAIACGLVIASCAPATSEATPPSSSPAAMSSSPAPSGPPVTVPGLSSAVPSSSASPSAAPTTSESPTPEPAAPVETTEPPPPAPAPAEPPQIDNPSDDFAQPAEPAAPAPAPAQLTGGKVVVIDPGHNGGNGANPSIINALVPAGFGKTKPCNTTGTSTNDGFPEHDFTWAVANDLKPMLEAQGITVIMTRSSDDGVGPCVDKRAAIGNDANADAVISIHGDGDDASAQGYYVMTAEQDPAGAEMAAQSRSFAVDVRDGLSAAGLSPSNHLGSAGLWPRNDLAGLNLSLRPTVMIEAGNMRNSADATFMSSSAGQQQVAQGLANGVLSYLGG